ncbi:MAG: sensor histidine kinase [Thermonemataceae bacterium]
MDSLKERQPTQAITIFPAYIIWGSSLLIAFLAFFPRLARLDFISFPEVICDSIAAFLLASILWYFNINILASKDLSTSLTKRVLLSAFVNSLTMSVFALLYVRLFPHHPLIRTLIAYQYRGLLVTLLLMVIIYSLLQNHKARVYSLELEQLKSENLRAQLSFLRQQINPHFFFNSLNILKSMVEVGDQQAPEVIMKLSEFYRSALQYNDGNKVMLKKELQIMEAYAYTLKVRFEEGLQVKQAIQDTALNTYIPPFTLQMLLENSIKHNTLSVAKPLIFSLTTENGFLVVSNNIQKKRTVPLSTKTGLENIKLRYQLMAKQPLEIVVDDHFFTVKLPLINEDTNY